jgi:hypothetical protein
MATSLLLAFQPIGAVNADEELLTDRPDFTETTVAMAPGRFQVEGGFTVARGVAVERVNAPEALLRLGLLRGAELRLGMDSEFANETVSGSGEGYVGFKLQLASGDAPLGLALIPAVTGPLWKNDAGEPEAGGEIVAAWSRALPDPWSVAGMFGVSFADENVYGATVSLARSLGERWGTFLEWAGESTDEGQSNLIHHGYTFGLGANAQVDTHFGLALGEEPLDWFFGAGLAIRR